MSAPRKKKAKPSLHPQTMRDGQAWYYEYRGGIDVIVTRDGSPTTSTHIPWSRLMKSAARCGWTVKRSAGVPSERTGE